ncbi:flagellar hook-basal body protein [Thermicanus aegyptius]|uniref:flagellar hook-basal body protein n=1 Tax=Thermicanus aegyptius TaxID=94009 RepID=UPI000415F32B|nr:flagellar hook-basal body protein [Thermicanus aegyptius]
MIRGFYTAASGMFAGQRRQEILTNNLTNAETPGYKADEAVLRAFPDMLMERIRDGEKSGIGMMQNGVYTHEVVPQFTTGALQETGNAYDFAIAKDPVGPNGERAVLFFTVEDNQGNRYYTRNGRFKTNLDGQLTTSDGFLVLDEQGNPIPVNGRNLEYTPDGRLILHDVLDPAITDEVRLGIVAFGVGAGNLGGNAPLPNVNLLVKGERGYFAPAQGGNVQPVSLYAPPLAGWTYEVKQGAVESSNVDLTKTMTEMMEVLRYYEANQRSLMTADRTLDRAVNEIGRV